MKRRLLPAVVAVMYGILFVGILFADDKPGLTGSERQAFIREHRPLWRLSAVVENDTVRLQFEKSHWYHYTPDKEDFRDIFSKIRIYRKKVDFNWSWDRDEVLNGMICTLTPEDIIFEGPLKPQYQRSYEYIDGNVERGVVYAYFVAGMQGPVTGPVAVKIRDPEVWWTKQKIAEELQRLRSAHPDLVSVEPIGKTHRGNDILAVTAGSGGKKLCLIGAVHASESGPELIVYFLNQLLEHHRPLLKEVSVIAVPCVNLDERHRAACGYPFYLRRNVTSVDLNRNFPADWEEVSYKYGSSTADPTSGTYRGPAPASEPETQAVVAFLRKHRPDVLLSYHHLASVAGKCLWAPAAAKDDAAYHAQCLEIYRAYDRGYSSLDSEASGSGEAEVFLRYAGSSGSVPMFGYREFGIPAFDVERHWKNDDLDYSAFDDTTPELLRRNQQRHAAALLNVMNLLAGRQD